jgi:hypothetical protein
MGEAHTFSKEFVRIVLNKVEEFPYGLMVRPTMVSSWVEIMKEKVYKAKYWLRQVDLQTTRKKVMVSITGKKNEECS